MHASHYAHADTNEVTRPTLNGLVSPPPRPVYNEHDTTHLNVLRQHHTELMHMIESLQKFTTLLNELYAKEIIDCNTYEKFLMKQESNPNCPPAVRSGLLLVDVHKHLEGKARLFDSFCECVKEVDHDCGKQLEGKVTTLFTVSHEV